MNFERKISLTGVEKLVYEVKGEMDKVFAAITLFKELDRITSIEFYSSLYGVTRAQLTTHTLKTQGWESEEIAQSLSHLNYHYTGKILDGAGDDELSLKIITDCLSYVTDTTLKAKVKEILEQSNFLVLVKLLN